MTTITIGMRSAMSSQVVSSMHEFRHDMFVRRLGWHLPQVDGIEVDQYDREDTFYVMKSNAEGRIIGCARLLPTTGPYMLPELFPQLLGASSAPRNGMVWELSRFAVAVRSTGDGRVLAPSKPALDLLHTALEFAGSHGAQRLVLVTSISIERLLLRAGLHVHRFGRPAHVNGERCVAVFIEVPKVQRATQATEQRATLVRYRCDLDGSLPRIRERNPTEELQDRDQEHLRACSLRPGVESAVLRP